MMCWSFTHETHESRQKKIIRHLTGPPQKFALIRVFRGRPSLLRIGIGTLLNQLAIQKEIDLRVRRFILVGD